MRASFAMALVLAVVGCGGDLLPPDDAGARMDASDARVRDARVELDASTDEDGGIDGDGGSDDADVETDGGSDAGDPDAGCASDRDADFVCDADDVCPDVADAAQLDTDEDGVGDACECDGVSCDGTACRAGVCDPTTGACIDGAPRVDGTACDDGDACTQTDACSSGTCAGTNPVECTAIDACHVAGVCDPSTGTCGAGAARPDGTACDDSDACTQIDACSSGTCTGTSPVVCTAIDACHVAGTCNPSTGTCGAGAARPNGTSCDDGNACTQTDACSSGTCTGTSPVVCTAIDACHVAGTCNPTTGACGAGAARPNGTACDDGNACTQTDACSSGTCTGTSSVVCTAIDACHVAGICDPSTGACGAGAARPDGTSCDDGDACTQTDACSSGTCTGSSPVVCAPLDICHAAGACNATTGTCSNPPAPCSTAVLVRVLDAGGLPILPQPVVRAFVGDTAMPQGGKVDFSGEITLTMPGGSYRFRAITESGLPVWSGTIDHCTMPSCDFVEIRMPASSPYVAVSWDPYASAAYTGGEIHSGSANVERGGVYLENWAVEHYGRSGAALIAAHDHVGDLTGDPDGYGNPTNAENQHAFGETLQGVFVRLSAGGAFDVVSLDYRIRSDSDPEHVSAVPGVDPTRVQIWISPVLDVGVPPATPFVQYEIGGPAEMTYWGTLFPGGLTGVTGVYITTTANVSIDNVVLLPR